MKRFNHYPEWKQEELGNWMFWPFVCFALIWVCAFAIDVTAIADRNDLDEAQHRGAIPAHVIQLSSDSYLMTTGVTVTPLDICLGGSTSGQGAEETRRIKSLDATYVECYIDQQWNVSEDTINPGFYDSLAIAIAKPEFIWAGIVGLMLTLFFPLIMLMREMVGAVQERRVNRKRAAAKKLDLEQARKELVKGYALPDSDPKSLTHLEFQEGMDKLYAQGLPRQNRRQT